MNNRAPARPSLQSTPTSRPRPAAVREKRSSAGASRAQGPHQLAQNTTSAARPFAPARSPASVTGGPARRSRGSAGARGPTEEECSEASPNTINAVSAAAAETVTPRTRRCRAIAEGSERGQQGHVVGYFGGLKARGVDGLPLARGRDSVDESRSVDELGLLLVPFGAHPPRLPHLRELEGRADQVLHRQAHCFSRQKRRHS